ncbi:protein of unknown function UPF0150 [Chthoniobacter flavus Ellin428]|uniref:HicB-like antitoxin of toxin-antitoxin system domain-containing protein n=1 Tax=Chthoniobacter flavus Ellin428 TaxID=497964 RepID=B4CWZ3_9BACT|nr:type II toxin-antitoxin system HicB family antitoxin [Chthoniobacter flavus]EDY21313.1 protein of unknown function UPF0150 [Chthoniobacter flavus Ellin428]TCO84918.1 HicB-like antitoxin of HicAB toxin-antitoxin system [Chthoniobacter flavus]
MKLRLVVEQHATTGRWASYFPEIPGCASTGDSGVDAIANAREALELWFEPTPLRLPKDARIVEIAVS